MSMTTAPNDIRLRPGALDKLKAEHEITSDAELARRLNLSAPMLSQMRTGHRGVGVAFIAGAYKAFGITVEDYPESIYQIVSGEQR
jgi:transcriptional regulator with XRE-family HTH domain